MCDDDWIFGDLSSVQILRDLVAAGSDIASGHNAKVGRPMCASKWWEENGKIIDQTIRPRHGVRKVDFAGTFVLARVSTFKRCRFDDRLKVGEHVDWYLRARRLGLTTCIDPGNVVQDGGHDQADGTQDADYMPMRNRARRMFQESLERWVPIFGRMEHRREKINCGIQNPATLPTIPDVFYDTTDDETHVWPSHAWLWKHVTPDVRALMGRCFQCYHAGGTSAVSSPPVDDRPVVAPPSCEAFLNVSTGAFGCVPGHLWMGEWLRRMVESYRPDQEDCLGLPLARRTAAMFEGDAAEVRIVE
jgi:hypothetical protein